jgi:hypothetical protein
MLTVLVTNLRSDIEEIKTMLRWQDELRSTIHPPPGDASLPFKLDAQSLDRLRNRAPRKLAWQVFDHCAAVSRIYAVFEAAVCDLVREYLSVLTKVSGGYESLGDRIHRQHRIGVGQILQKWGSGSMYQHLAERDIAAGMVDGLRGEPYTLLTDAFLLANENFRSDALDRLFSPLGFDSTFGWIQKAEPICEFRTSKIADTETAKSFLDGIIRSRNAAVHERSPDLVSVAEALNYADFVVLVVDAIASLLRTTLLRLGQATNYSQKIGEVIKKWSNNVVGVRASGSSTIRTGDRLYVGKRQLAPSTVVSLELDKITQPSITLSSGIEFGLKLDRKERQGAEIYKIIDAG